MKTSRVVVLALVGVGLLGASAALSTRSASCPVLWASGGAPPPRPAARAAVRAEGRVAAYPGAEVVVSAEAAGRLERLTVTELARVARGETLAVIDSASAVAQVREATARVAEAEADRRLAEVELARRLSRKAADTVTKEECERAARNLDVALARVAVAQASLEHAEAALRKTRVVAPIDGVVTVRSVQPGEFVTPGTPLVTVCDLSRVRVEAEVDEFDVGRVALGDPVAVRSEGTGETVFRGRVEEIPAAVVRRRTRPDDPGRPTDTRVLLVKVALLEPAPWKLGQKVETAVGLVAGP